MAVAAANAMKIVFKTGQGRFSLIKPYLFSTFSITASVTTGDFICQYLDRKENTNNNNTNMKLSTSLFPWWNSQRSLIMCASAVFVATPWGFTQARVLERLFPGIQTKQIMKKMLTGTLFAPIGISLIFTFITLLKGESFHEAKIKVKNDTPKTFLAGMCYWPFVSFMNFRFISLDYRPFVASLAGAIWNVYISSIANKTEENSNDNTRQTLTVLITETGGTGIPALQETWRILDDNKNN